MKPQTQAPAEAHTPKCRDCGGTHDVTPTGSPMDCLRYWRTRAITGEAHMGHSHAALVEALKDIGLQCCQTRLAAGIGRTAAKNRTDFLLGSLRRIETAADTALALAHGDTQPTKEVQS